MPVTKSKTVERKPYTVLVDNHSHQGKPVVKNSKIDLTEEQAKWLKGKGVI